jgi:signal transduction histidine kinase
MIAGTTLAPVISVSEPEPSQRHADVWRHKRDQLLAEDAHHHSSWLLAFGLLFNLAIFGVLLTGGDYPYWRVGAIGAAYLVFMVVQKTLMKFARACDRIDTAIIAINMSSQLLVVITATVTGGIHSPFLPSLIMPSVVSLLFFGPHAAARWMALGNGLLVVAMICLPDAVVGPQVSHLQYTLVALLVIAWNVILLHRMVHKLTSAAQRAGESMACLREERVTEAEAQMRRLQGVGAKVAHELKNPLASIKGLCQLVARTPASERTQERLAVVASEISRMETILNEYLSFSRPLEDLKPESIDITAIAKDVMDVVAGRADQAGVGLALAGNEARVEGDPRRLKEALINLVSNAIEATPDGGAVALRVARTPAAVTLEVADTGRGISSEDLERLGTSFFTTRPGGTGLGVVLAQSVITQHGGTLHYASHVGRGTTATITLPVAPKPSLEVGARAAIIEARA